MGKHLTEGKSVEASTLQDQGAQDQHLKEAVWKALGSVSDPEIPALSVVDLGMVESLEETDGHVVVRVTPTFVGCPAIALIRRNIEQQIQAVAGVVDCTVEISYRTVWTSERVTCSGREKLRAFGIAPPENILADPNAVSVACPYCGSKETRLDNLFGPTACRSTYYCLACHQPFEAMKPV